MKMSGEWQHTSQWWRDTVFFIFIYELQRLFVRLLNAYKFSLSGRNEVLWQMMNDALQRGVWTDQCYCELLLWWIWPNVSVMKHKCCCLSEIFFNSRVNSILLLCVGIQVNMNRLDVGEDFKEFVVDCEEPQSWILWNLSLLGTEVLFFITSVCIWHWCCVYYEASDVDLMWCFSTTDSSHRKWIIPRIPCMRCMVLWAKQKLAETNGAVCF